MQAWKKLGLLYCNQEPSFTHSAVPIAHRVDQDMFEIFFSARDKDNRSLPFSLRLDLASLKVLDVRKKPILLPGNAGEFDVDGVMPTCLLSEGHRLYMFYIGWKREADVPFRNALGVAISDDQGKTFTKQRGPVLERSVHDPGFVASCDVVKVGAHFKMWYLSALKWEKLHDQWRPRYHIKDASSTNLISWERKGHVAIDFLDQTEYAISTPRVHVGKSGNYRMWYSHRGGARNQTYRIGYAESADGLSWSRKDGEVILPPGNEGWDSEMICYPFLFENRGNLYMLYNGNGYGKSGIGLAVLKT